MQVRIVRLDPLCVACVRASGLAPEAQAWATLLRWAGAEGLLGGAQPPRLFGREASAEDGRGQQSYDAWVTLRPAGQRQLPEGVGLARLAGGVYAVTRCRLADSADTWVRLGEWVSRSPYHPDGAERIEEYVTLPEAPWQEILLDLYLPVVDNGCAAY
jgi:DNA gyrase inhibitor GyrI